MRIHQTVVAALFASTLLFVLPGCDEQGPLEEAGEKIDDGVENTGDAIEDATDRD